MKNRKIVFGLLGVLFVYMLLSVVNTLYWTEDFLHNEIVASVGPMTDGEFLDSVWLPGQFLSFFMGIALGSDVPIIGGFITYVIYALLVLKLSGISPMGLLRPQKLENQTK